ncbi:MAG: hypothetical protein ACOCZR_01295 [Halanaerobiales bacterium]
MTNLDFDLVAKTFMSEDDEDDIEYTGLKSIKPEIFGQKTKRN